MSKLEEKIVIRMPVGWTIRAERLAEIIAKSPEYEAMGSFKKSAVFRLAMDEGLKVLEKKFNVNK